MDSDELLRMATGGAPAPAPAPAPAAPYGHSGHAQGPYAPHGQGYGAGGYGGQSSNGWAGQQQYASGGTGAYPAHHTQGPQPLLVRPTAAPAPPAPAAGYHQQQRARGGSFRGASAAAPPAVPARHPKRVVVRRGSSARRVGQGGGGGGGGSAHGTSGAAASRGAPAAASRTDAGQAPDDEGNSESEAGGGGGERGVWAKLMDKQYNTPYYYNIVTEESVWEEPPEYTPERDAYANSGAADADADAGSGAGPGGDYWEEQETQDVAWGEDVAAAAAATADDTGAGAGSGGGDDGNPYNEAANGGAMQTPSPKTHGKGGKNLFTPMSASSRGSRLDPMTPFSTSTMSDDDEPPMTPITPTPVPKGKGKGKHASPPGSARSDSSNGQGAPTPSHRGARRTSPFSHSKRGDAHSPHSTGPTVVQDDVAPARRHKGSRQHRHDDVGQQSGNHNRSGGPGASEDASSRGSRRSEAAKPGPPVYVKDPDAVPRAVHEAEMSRLRAAAESAAETATLKLELVETKLRQEMDVLRLESEQRIRRMEHAAETKHQQALEKVRGEVAAREREAFDEQKALLANERQEALSRYSAEVRAVKEQMSAERERVKAEAYAAGAESMRPLVASMEKKLGALDERLTTLQSELDAKRDRILELESAATRAESALHEAKSASQVALMEARQQLVEEWSVRLTEASSKLQDRLSQREREIAAMQAARTKDREELHSQARQEYARGREEANKEWEAKTRTQSSSQAQSLAMKEHAHAAELQRARTETEAQVRAEAERERVAAVDSVRSEMEALLQRETRKLEHVRAATAEEKAELTRQLHEEQERATKEYYRGREEATREWSDKVQHGAVVSAKDADAAIERRVAAVSEALKAEAEARLEKFRADAASKLQAVKHEAQMASMKAASAATAELEAAQSACKAEARARAAAEERAAKAEAALAVAEKERARLTKELDAARSESGDVNEKARAAVEKALASKRKYKTQVEHLKGVLIEAADAAQGEREEAVREAEEKVRSELQREAAESAAALSAAAESKLASALAEAAREREAIVQEASRARAAAQEQHQKDLADVQGEALRRLETAVQDAVSEAVAAESKRTEAMVARSAAERDQAVKSWKREAELRRKAHNRVLELQGNIRVMCRVRPILAVERKSSDAEVATTFPEEDALAVQSTRRRDDGRQQEVFEFDRVFNWDTSQSQVFDEVRPLVTSVLDGYNVCIFAYGQTGSGKTFTMEGEADNRGVNFRALEELFLVRDARRAVASYTFTVSVLEIYNEQVRDLLDASGDRKSLEIRMAGSARGGEGRVSGLSRVEVASADDVLSCMRLASSQRAVGGHDVNERSSRSHSVVTVYVKREREGRPPSHSKLNLIDLAGSERVGKTHASGERLREAQHINKSLSALGDVVAALGAKGKKAGHVPFRNSKLTYLLQDSLAHGSKVMMFVNVSPVMWNVSETLCSLRFAKRCASVQLGQAKKSTDSVAHLKAIIADLEKAIAARGKR